LQQDYQEVVVEPIQTKWPPEQRLGAVLEKIVELNSSAKWVNCRLLVRLTQDVGRKGNDLSRKISETVDFLLEFLSRCVEEATRAGLVKANLDPQTLSRLILSTLFGALNLQSLESSPLQLDELVKQLQSLITTTD